MENEKILICAAGPGELPALAKNEILLYSGIYSYTIESLVREINTFPDEDEIKKIKDKIKIDFGSGYMTDERTVNFLKKYHSKYDNLFRKTWASYKKVFQKDLTQF